MVYSLSKKIKLIVWDEMGKKVPNAGSLIFKYVKKWAIYNLLYIYNLTYNIIICYNFLRCLMWYLVMFSHSFTVFKIL